MHQSPDLAVQNSGAPKAPPSEIVLQSEIEQLLAGMGAGDAAANGPSPANESDQSEYNFLRRHEFPKLSLFPPTELRQLRERHEEFITSLAARLSAHLRMEVRLQMSGMEAIPFQRFADALSDPTYLTLLKLEPLRGIALLDMPPRLALCIVDREMGGTGRMAEEAGQLLEVRQAILGTETNSRFLRTSTPTTCTLVVAVEVRIGEVVEQMQFAFPHSLIEPLLCKLNSKINATDKQEAAAKSSPSSWNALYDNLDVELRAVLPEIELPVEQLSALKPGDILPLPPEFMHRVRLLVSNYPGFVGNLGTAQQRRAVRIEKQIGG
jgi:flagellar motor switch protein FliM